MKYFLLLLVFSCSITKVWAQEPIKEEQEDKSNLGFHSISISPIGFYLSNRDSGFVVNAELILNMSNHLFKIYAGTGSEINLNLMGGETINDSYAEYDLLYGREFFLTEEFHLELFAGVGLFHFIYNRNSSTDYYQEKVVGFPLQAKAIIAANKVFSGGVQLNMNINTAVTVVQPGLFLRWKL